MTTEKSFTVSELRQYHRLSDEQIRLEERKREIADQLAKLENEQSGISEELARIEEKLGYEFTDLQEAADLFSAHTARGEQTDPSLEAIKGASYVKKEMKGPLLRKILSDFGKSNPDTEAMTYTQVKTALDQDYDIQCRSIANFFVGLLDEYETTGGNRNKAIVLPKS